MDANVGRGRPALMPMKIAQLLIWGDRALRRAVSRGWAASGVIACGLRTTKVPSTRAPRCPRSVNPG